MEKEDIIYIIFIVIIVLFAYYFENKRITKLENYEEYYNKTETLIDSIASQHEDFLDTTCEQDVYVEYLEARKKLQ